jgi:crotonobetainyl-CoA:carnitine CoA-transferase CaiB-like acyl-CoA transferase
MLVPVNTLADIAADPQLAARGYFAAVEHDGRDPVPYPTAWAHLSRTPLTATPRAPAVGADNQAVWLGEIGLDAAELRAYQLAGTI